MRNGDLGTGHGRPRPAGAKRLNTIMIGYCSILPLIYHCVCSNVVAVAPSIGESDLFFVTSKQE